jgi:hypothetical protein
LEEYDHRDQQNPPFSKLHIELLEQLEGSTILTDFIEPLLQKQIEQPWKISMRTAPSDVLVRRISLQTV